MHHHDGGAGGAGDYLNILPLWVQVVWVLLLAGVVAMHLLTLGFARGQAQVWTAAHTLMGLAMLYMFLPWSQPPIPGGGFVALFCALAVIGLLGFASSRGEGRPVLLMWLFVTVDMAATAYLFQMPDRGFGLLTYALAAWYAATSVVWAYGVPDPSLARCCAVPFAGEQPVPPLPLARAAQAVMAAGMSWMFLAMEPQFGAHLARAFDGGLEKPTYWVLASAGLLFRFACDPTLVRRLAGPLWESGPGIAVPEARRPGALDGAGDVDAARLAYPFGLELLGDVLQHEPVDLLVHAGEAPEQVRP
jgi:hypothetical protein